MHPLSRLLLLLRSLFLLFLLLLPVLVLIRLLLLGILANAENLRICYQDVDVRVRSVFQFPAFAPLFLSLKLLRLLLLLLWLLLLFLLLLLLLLLFLLPLLLFLPIVRGTVIRKTVLVLRLQLLQARCFLLYQFPQNSRGLMERNRMYVHRQVLRLHQKFGRNES